jgi:hypothetical protein
MNDPERLTDDLEQAMQGRKLLVIACNESGDLSLEQNDFHAWMLDGVAHWLELYAQTTMEQEMQQGLEEE